MQVPSLLEAKTELARRRLIYFTQFTKKDYQVNWHHNLLASKLDDMLSGKIKKLIVSMPPRHGKSQLVSRHFPAYSLGINPNINIIAASYSSDLSSKMNKDVQRIIDCNEYKFLFPSTRLTEKRMARQGNVNYSRNSSEFEVVGHKGSYRSTGVGGGITGMGCDLAIIDDPIKDMKEALSLTTRNSIWDWYVSTLATRIEEGGATLVTMTRWHKDDLVGRILATDPTFEVLEIPAIRTENGVDKALWPKKFSLENLQQKKITLGSKVFSSLYQQNPMVDGGAFIKDEWLRYYNYELNSAYSYIMSWDMAFKGSDNSDYVVGQVWAKQPKTKNYFLVDQVRGQWDFPKTIQMFASFCQKWPQASRKVVEAKANGQAVIDTLRNKISGIVPYSPKESKESRLHSISPLFEAGQIFLPENQPFVQDFVDEITQFPYHKNDDQVDACVQALINFKSSEAKFSYNKSKSNLMPI